jgi:hypothetical protein
MLCGSILVVPWWLRNISLFGTSQPFPLIIAASARDYSEWFNYEDAPSLDKLFAQGWGPVLELRLNALLQIAGVIILSTFPFGFLGVPIAVFRRETLFRVFTAYGMLLCLVSGLVFPVPALTGSFYHSVGTFGPWAALSYNLALRRWLEPPAKRRLGVFIGLTTLVLVVAQAALGWPPVIQGSVADRAKFDLAADWLRANAPVGQPVIATQAHSLNYASGYPALTLPNGQDLATLRRLADHYGARFVVVTERVGLYPDALDAAGVRKRLDAGGVLIYEMP